MNDELRNAGLKDKLRYYFGLPRRLLALKVVGNSMSPSITADDVILYDPVAVIEVGDIVLTAHPFMQSVKIVKRVAKIGADSEVTLTGDNPAESTDSRTFGAVSVESIIGKVVCRLQ
ncbi:MAG: nickel-type superoxide dismutase maturation protease [Pyrinomonadaceae bacterium]